MMSRMAPSRPPGVSICTMMSCAPPSSAACRARSKYWLVAGPMAPSMRISAACSPRGSSAHSAPTRPASPVSSNSADKAFFIVAEYTHAV